jgi:hypothetical protein
MNNVHSVSKSMLAAIMIPVVLVRKKPDISNIRFSRSVFMLFVIACTSYILLNTQISSAVKFATIANQTATIANQTPIVSGTSNIKIPCADPETGKPQLPCPPPGKCLGPDDRPIPCPNPGQCLGQDNKPVGCPRLSLSIDEIFVKQTGGNKTIFNGTISRTAHNLTGTIGQIADQFYKLGEEFDKKTGIKPGDPITFQFRNNSRVTIPYTGSYKNPLVEDFLKDILVPLDGGSPCWVYLETSDGIPVQRHFPNCAPSLGSP